jgi:hypothetical protein
MHNFSWGCAMLGAALGVCMLLFTLALSKSAMQEASGAGFSIAFGALPYIFARAVDELSKD